MTSAATVGRHQSETLFATPAIVADRRADGSIVLKSLTPLRDSARCVGDWLEQWARQVFRDTHSGLPMWFPEKRA